MPDNRRPNTISIAQTIIRGINPVKLTLIILTSSILLFVALLFALGVMSRSGQAPGISAGRLIACPNKPNCVCSESAPEAAAYIQPLPLPSSMDTADVLSFLGEIINAMGGRVQAANDTYVATTFSSDIFGFVDDLEIRIADDEGVIHIRSASRVGYSDGGVNKNRVEAFRARFFEAVQTAP